MFSCIQGLSSYYLGMPAHSKRIAVSGVLAQCIGCVQEHTSKAVVHLLMTVIRDFTWGEIPFSLFPLSPPPQNLYPQLLYARTL